MNILSLNFNSWEGCCPWFCWNSKSNQTNNEITNDKTNNEIPLFEIIKQYSRAQLTFNFCKDVYERKT